MKVLDSMRDADSTRPIRVIIDTDVSIGIPERDVDDGLALVMACNSKQLSISAITLTYGNSTLKNVSNAMRRLNEYLNIPEDSITCGATSAGDLGKRTDAVDSLITLLERHKHTVISIGPLTNIATAIKMRSDLVQQIDQLVVVAGRRPGCRFLTGNYPLSHPDLNFEKDPNAAEFLLQSGVSLKLAPFELSSKIWITESILDRIRMSGTPTGEFLYKACMPWLELWRKRFSTDSYPIIGFNPFDCLAIACVTDADLVTNELCEATIEEDNYDATDKKVQGSGGAKKPYLHVRPKPGGPYSYAFDIVREDFLDSLIARLK